MRLQHQIKRVDDYLVAEVTGEWVLESVVRLTDEVAQDCQDYACNRVLIDCMQVEILGQVLAFERYVIGRRVGERLQGLRVAALVPADQINKMAESIAIQAGVQILVTSDRKEALAWLAAGNPSEAETATPAF